MNHFSGNLCRLRRARGLRQRHVAARAGIPRSTYASYEERKNEPPLEIMVTILEVLNYYDIRRMVREKINFEPTLFEHDTAVLK